MNLIKRFDEFVAAENLFTLPDVLLITVSGGIDSVVLCEICRQAGYRFKIAHCNFQLRGAESERDERFVRELAEKYGTELLVKRFDTSGYASEKKVSTQVAARELRYEWFQQIPGVDYILTAHHGDDNIETMLMNFFKGTGIGGLHGILPRQERLVRPLLFASKDDIRAFALENKLSYVEDSSNISDKYTRNYFRNQLIPAIEKVYPNVTENLRGNISRFRDIELLYRQSVAQHKKKLLEWKDGEARIPVLKLKKAVPLNTLLYEIIRDFNFTPAQVKEVEHILHGESGKYIASSTYRIIKNRDWLIISPLKPEESEHIIIEETDHLVNWNNRRLTFQKVASPLSLSTSPLAAQLDAAKITFPLLLRKWKKGDYFYPLGMKKKKKLSRFFTDQKLSLTDKENAWVLEMDKKIIWIVGWRIDDRFKITSATIKVLLIKCLENTNASG